jgi:hypothetical protein
MYNVPVILQFGDNKAITIQVDKTDSLPPNPVLLLLGAAVSTPY